MPVRTPPITLSPRRRLGAPGWWWCLVLAAVLLAAPPGRAGQAPEITVLTRDLPPSARLILSWGKGPAQQASLHKLARPVELVIKATGRRNPAARNSLVRVVALELPGRERVPEADFQIEPGWIYRRPERKQALVFTGQGPARAMWRGEANGDLKLVLAENRASGIVEISWCGQTRTEDLYAPQHANRLIVLPLPPAPSRWAAALPPGAQGKRLELRVITPCPHKGGLEAVAARQADGAALWEKRDLKPDAVDQGAPFTQAYHLAAGAEEAARPTAPVPLPALPRDLAIDHRYHNQDASAACGVPDTLWWPRTSFDAAGVLHLVRVNSPRTSPGGAPTSTALGRLSIGSARGIRPRPLEGWLPIYDWDLDRGRLRLMALPDSWAADAVEVTAETRLPAVLEVFAGKLAVGGSEILWQGSPLLALAGRSLAGALSPDGRRLEFILPPGRSLLLRNLNPADPAGFRRAMARAARLNPAELTRVASAPWQRLVDGAAELRVSNPAVSAAWRNCLAQLFLLRSSYQGGLRVHGTGGTVQGGAYDWGFWYRDYAWHLTALASAGLAGPAAAELDLFWRHQAPDGLLAAPERQYDGFGQAARAAFRALALNPGSGREEAVYARLLAGAKAQSALGPAARPGAPRSCLPLLPPGEGDGGVSGPGKLVLHHNTWTLLGLDRLARLARRLGRDPDAKWLDQERARLGRALSGALPFYFVGAGPGAGFLSGSLSADSFRARPTPSWMGYTVFWPQYLPAQPGAAGMFAATNRHLDSHAFQGLPIGLGWEADTVWPYNAANWARARLARGDPAAGLRILQSVLNTAWHSGTWAEEYFVVDGGRALGKARRGYDIPNTNLHVTAPATALLLLRDLVLREEVAAGALHLASALPWGWDWVDLTRAPTLFGQADFTLRREPGLLRARLRLAGPAWSQPERVVLHLPLAPGQQAVTARLNGREVPVMGDRVIVTAVPPERDWQWEVRLR